MLINHDKKLVYIPIDKCASSLLKEYLGSVQNFAKNTSNKKLFFGYKYFAIIRNPKDRWISGLNQYIFNEMKRYYRKFYYDNIKFFETDEEYVNYRNKFDNYLKDVEKLIFEYVRKKLLRNKFIFDSHTKPQSDTIDNVIEQKYYLSDKFQLLLVRLDNNLIKKISSILEKDETDLLYLNTNKFKHNMSESDYKIVLFPKCQEYYSEFCENNKNFIEMYAKDCELFNEAI
jgi:hypothetical protein